MDQLTESDRVELEAWLDTVAKDANQQPVPPKPRQYRSAGDQAANDPDAYYRAMFGDNYDLQD